MDNPEAKDADQDQVEGDDVVKQPRHDENEDARDERDNRLQMSDANDHDPVFPGWNAELKRRWKAKSSNSPLPVPLSLDL